MLPIGLPPNFNQLVTNISQNGTALAQIMPILSQFSNNSDILNKIKTLLQFPGLEEILNIDPKILSIVSDMQNSYNKCTNDVSANLKNKLKQCNSTNLSHCVDDVFAAVDMGSSLEKCLFDQVVILLKKNGIDLTKYLPPGVDLNSINNVIPALSILTNSNIMNALKQISNILNTMSPDAAKMILSFIHP